MTSIADVRDAPPRPVALPAVDRLALGVALALLLAGAGLIAEAVSVRQAALLLIGALLGAALFHAAFGFTGGWRSFVRERRSAGLRSQMLMLAIATGVMLPFIAGGNVLGFPVGGNQAPVGVAVIIGAALFGLGMQLGGGCGSGTLFTVGGGSVRMLVTLAFFIIGSVIGSAHVPWWLSQPHLGVIRLWSEIGLWQTILLQWVLFAAIAWVAAGAEARRHGSVASIFAPAPPETGLGTRLLRGPWPLAWGAVALALLNLLTLAVAGHPWSITSGFALWGAKIYAAFGGDVASWPFWAYGGAARKLAGTVLADTISVMDFGLILGAMAAAALAGRFAPGAALPLGSLIAAVIGGLLMGYGARISFGCNIGALFSGIASGSLHGWLWFAAAFAGSWAGVHLRPLFGFRE